MAKAIRFFHKGQSFFDGSSLASGYKLFQYQAGTTTKANTYTDSGKGTANSNPMTLNSDGRLDQDVYIDRSMKFVLATSAAGDPPSSSEWTVDNALSLEQLWTTSTKTANYSVLESDRDKFILVDATSGAITITLLAAATAGDGFQIGFKKSDSSTNAVTIDGNSSETIDGSTTYVLSDQLDSIIITCDGSNWFVHSASGFPSTASSNDSRTDSVAYPFVVAAETSGTPAAGIGTGIEIKAESADEAPSSFGRLNFVADDVTAGSEDTYFAVQTRVAGAALADAYNFKVTAANKYVFTGAPSATRTITLPDSSITLGNVVNQATQSAIEAETNEDTYVPPDLIKNSPGVAKAYVYILNSGTPSIQTSYNITSIADTATGRTTVTIATDFTNSAYVIVANPYIAAGNATGAKSEGAQTAGAFIVNTYNTNTGASVDADCVAVCYGDQ